MPRVPRNRTLGLAFTTILVDMLGFGITFPILPALFSEDKGWFPQLDPDMLGLWYGGLQASFALAQFVGAPILGALSDRFGRKPILLLSLTGAAAGYLLFAYGILHASVGWMFAGRIIPGFCGGNIGILYSSMADISGGKDKVRNFGLAGSAFGLGMILGPVVGGILSKPGYLPISGYHVPFLVMAVLSVANGGLAAAFFRETLPATNPTPISPLTGFRNIGRAFRHPRLKLVFATVLVHASGFSLFIHFVQFYLMEVHGLQEAGIGYIFGYVGAWTVVTQAFLVRPLADRLAPERVVANVIILLAVSFLVFLLPRRPLGLYIVLPLATIAQGLYMPNMTAVVSNLSDRAIQGRMLGINQSLTALSNAVPPLIGGWMLLYGVRLPIVVAVGFHLVAWGIFNLFYRRHRKQKKSGGRGEPPEEGAQGSGGKEPTSGERAQA